MFELRSLTLLAIAIGCTLGALIATTRGILTNWADIP